MIKKTYRSGAVGALLDIYEQAISDLKAVMENIVFNSIGDNELEQFDDSLKIKASWGQVYDIEQMTEHAVVHILRHKRQIEKIKLLFRSDA